jgi:uncharacterized protein YbjT (DUF2867 family)
VARALIVGCGCRGQSLARALIAGGLPVRGTTRRPEVLPAIEAAGAEAVLADPDRLATLVPHLEGVSVVCWRHGGRLETLLEYIVDTPVRGFVYEATGAGDGARLVEEAGERWRLSVAVVRTPPEPRAEWLDAMSRAVRSALA